MADFSKLGAARGVVPEGPFCMVMVILSDPPMAGRVEGLAMSDDAVD